MKNIPTTPWTRLTAAARRAPGATGQLQSTADLIPSGFATRVVARAEVGNGGGILGGALFERLAARALGLAGGCTLVLAVWAGRPATVVEVGALNEATLVSEAYFDPVGTMLEAVQS